MKTFLYATALLALAACTAPPLEGEGPIQDDVGRASKATLDMYGPVEDGGWTVEAIPQKYMSEDRKRQEVAYYAPYAAGTIVVDPGDKRLYHLQGDDRAVRYTVGVGKAGYDFTGEARVQYQRDWPGWTPTANMIRREPETYEQWRGGMEGGPENPLGARALYLYRGGRDTLYRIHGTPYPWTVGSDASSGCIRMFNQDAMYLATQVENGSRVIVLDRSEAGKWTSGSGEGYADAS